MAQQNQGSGRRQNPSQDQGRSQRKPNLDQGGDAMSRRPEAANTESDSDRGAETSRDEGSSTERGRRPIDDEIECQPLADASLVSRS